MQAKDAIRGSMDLSMMVFKSYLDDLEDSELMIRPGDGCNHMAWQIGHLINSEVNMLEGICPGKAAKLPDGFAEAHSKDKAGSDDPSDFLSNQEYWALFDKVRQSTIAALEEMSDEELDAPGPEQMRTFCPTVGNVFVLIATHPMMHAGQAVPIRRKLKKPVKF